MKPAALAVIALAVLLAGCSGGSGDFPYSGTVQAESAGIGSTVGGRVTGVFAQDGQRVDKGAVIVRFDDRQLRAARDAAQAQVDQARAALADLVAGPRPADVAKAAASAAQAESSYRSAQLSLPQQTSAAMQAVREAQADLGSAHAAEIRAVRDYQRDEVLFRQGAISAQTADAALADARSSIGARVAAAARLRSARAAAHAVQSGSAAESVASAGQSAEAADANLALVKEGARPDQIAQAQAALAAAVAAEAEAQARLDECAVQSPASGIVDGLDLHAGDLVNAGAAVATIDEFADPWVRIYVSQSDLGRFAVGSALRVRSDANPGRTFTGRVETIDQTAQFTPRDVQTSSDRADLAFGIKVRIHDPDRVLRSGTTVEVSAP